MLITVFRSRVRPENAEEYMKVAAKMSELAQSMTGYVSHKGSAFTFPGDSRPRS